MGPLHGIRIIELAGIGPGPFCSMLLSDLGAEVIRVDRVGAQPNPASDVLLRGRRSLTIDMKSADGVGAILRLVEKADAMIEGFRPGVMERLGLGPDVCLKRNPRLVYGRMTGWGQEGPLAHAAGHDINYIALIGALGSVARQDEKPVPPLNLVGDFGGGALYLAVGILAALLEAKASGKGQVVDAAMVDGAASLMTMFYELRAAGFWTDEPGTNLLDTGAHFYDVYETSDGKHVAIGSIEPKFYAELLRLSGLEKEELPYQFDRSQWPIAKERLAKLFRTKTRDEWCRIMEGSDVCFAPVLAMSEVANHPHIKHRNTFVEANGVTQAAPSPRFSRTVPKLGRPPSHAGQHSQEVLESFGFGADEITKLRDAAAVV